MICPDFKISGQLRLPGIPEMKDFPNILEILDFDFLLANPGIPDKAMISVRFPLARLFENRNFSPRNFSPKPEKVSGKVYRGKVSRGECIWGEEFL